MGYQYKFLRFSFTKEQFIELLLLQGTIEVKSLSTEDKITLNSAKNHLKYGLPGVEDGTNHTFESFIGFGSGHYKANIAVNTEDGETYIGGAAITIEPEDNMSESG